MSPDVLVILDGASEPLGRQPTSLERAATPVLDRLAREGSLTRLRTVPEGLTAGSEVAIPVLLGWTPSGPVDRAAIEAAARGIDVRAGERAWRVDVFDGDGKRAPEAATRRAAQKLQTNAPAHVVHRLAGHRLLLVGPEPLPGAAREPGLQIWPDGVAVPETLGVTTLVVAARGAGLGVGALLGATTLAPDGATGGPDTDLRAKADAAVGALRAGTEHVVVHLGGADEAAHAGDAEAKVAFLERADRELLTPLVDAVVRSGGTLRVCPDHGCDPATGRHDAHPVPCVQWSATGARNTPAGPGGGRSDLLASSARRPGRPARRLTERAVAELPVVNVTVRTAVPA